MRIDALQVAATMNQADLASIRRDRMPQKKQPEDPQAQQRQAAPSGPLPAPTQISVSIDSDKNVIYEFLDVRTGEVIQQVPPEQVLQVMRSIADQLRQSQRNLEITV